MMPAGELYPGAADEEYTTAWDLARRREPILALHARAVAEGEHQCDPDCPFATSPESAGAVRYASPAADPTPDPRTYWPSFYSAVHRAYNATGRIDGFRVECFADESPYEPAQHACYRVAGLLRVELHAGGIRLSNDGNGSNGGETFL